MGGVCIFMQKMVLRYGDEKTRINKLNEKHLLIPWRLKVLILKINFCREVLQPYELPRRRERGLGD